MKIKHDKEGTKTEEVLPNGLKITTLVEPSSWYIDNVLKPMQEERNSRKQKFEEAERIGRKMIEIAKRELDLEN